MTAGFDRPHYEQYFFINILGDREWDEGELGRVCMSVYMLQLYIF